MAISFLRVTLFSGLSLFLLSQPSPAAEETYKHLTDWQDLPERNVGRTPPNWIKNTRFNSGDAVLVSRSEGRLLSLTTPGDAEHPFHLYFREHFALPDSGTITITLEASGNGSIGAFCYLYDEEGGSLGMVPKDGDGMRSVDGEEWVTLRYEVPINAEAIRRGHPTGMRFALVVAPGSEIIVKLIQAKAD